MNKLDELADLLTESFPDEFRIAVDVIHIIVRKMMPKIKSLEQIYNQEEIIKCICLGVAAVVINKINKEANDSQ